jgi:hypothetical protein
MDFSHGGTPVKRLLTALVVLAAVFLAYAFAAMAAAPPGSSDAGLAGKLRTPFDKIDGGGAVMLALGAGALLFGLYLVFSGSGAGASAAPAAARFGKFGAKTKGLEIGFLLSGVAALAVLAMIVFGTAKAWFSVPALGALGAVFVLQLVMGLLFVILFLKKKDKVVAAFVPALALFLFEVAIGAYGVFMGLK